VSSEDLRSWDALADGWSEGVHHNDTRLFMLDPAHLQALGAAAAVISYAFGQGGPVAGLIFCVVLVIGALVKLTEPLRASLRP